MRSPCIDLCGFDASSGWCRGCGRSREEVRRWRNLRPGEARKVAADEVEDLEVDRAVIRELIGRPRVHPERMAAADVVGVATGMFYTPMGGDIMFVEASIMPGEGKDGFTLTGQLGDVMKESARAALSFTKAHWKQLGIEEDSLRGRDVHIHVPAGAIPKDGPSAGITMATALVSAVSGRKVRHNVSMTGELTLTGRVLAIGGLKEKVLGAVRAGITEVILPIDNEADLEDIPDEVREGTTFHLAETLDDVISTALVGGKSTAKTIAPMPSSGANSAKKAIAKKNAGSAKKAGPKKKAAPKKKADPAAADPETSERATS